MIAKLEFLDDGNSVRSSCRETGGISTLPCCRRHLAAPAAALELAREKGVECRFVEADVTEDVARHEDAFDLGYDWEVLPAAEPGSGPLIEDYSQIESAVPR